MFLLAAQTLDEIADPELVDPRSSDAETHLLVEEAKLACTTGMLLCLEPRQRVTFILGEILGVTDDVGAEILEASEVNFRQILFRARRDLYNFMNQSADW